MARFWSIATLVVGGVIVANILTHPTGTRAAADSARSLIVPSYQALLGQRVG